MKKYANALIEQFHDEELAHAHFDDFLNIYIATQIKVLREQRGLTQKKLAELAGMEQPRISVMEDIDYNAWSISTLKKLARAFDVSLKVSFESFDTLIADTGNFGRSSLMRASRLEALKKLECAQHAGGQLEYDFFHNLGASNEATAPSNKIATSAVAVHPGTVHSNSLAVAA